MDVEEHLLWIARDWRHLGSISKQTEEMCMLAIGKSAKALSYVRSPTQAMANLAVQKDPKAIEFVPPGLRNEALWLSAVERDGMALYHAVARQVTSWMDKQTLPLPISLSQGATPKVVRAAVEQNHQVLEWVIPSEENVEALRSSPAMARLVAFEFVLQPFRKRFTPSVVLERFLNPSGMFEHEIKKVLSLLVRRGNTPLLLRCLREPHWSNQERKKWIKTSVNMVRGSLGFDRSIDGHRSAQLSVMLHALTTLKTGDTARSLLLEMNESTSDAPVLSKFLFT